MGQSRPPIKIEALTCVSMHSSYANEFDEFVGVIYNGVRANSHGIHCLSITKPGNKRGTNVELGFILRIVIGKRVYHKPDLNRRWQQIAAEIGGFIENKSANEWARDNLGALDFKQYEYSEARDAMSSSPPSLDPLAASGAFDQKAESVPNRQPRLLGRLLAMLIGLVTARR